MSSQPTGEHVVHRRDSECSLLPQSDALVDLGLHESCAEAVRAARSVYGEVDACPRCAPECNRGLSEEAIIAALSAAISAGLVGT